MWHVATGQLIGKNGGRPYGPIMSVAFSPDGSKAAAVENTMSGDRTWVWPVADLEGDPERFSVWTEVQTGLELDEHGAARPLDNAAWNERRERLATLGGPPAAPR